MYSRSLRRSAILRHLPFRLLKIHVAFVGIIAALSTAEFVRCEDRTFDGSGNNLAHPLWGSAGSDYSREASGAHYADSIFAPQIAGYPARACYRTCS